MGDKLYKRIQKTFGTLKADPMSRVNMQVEMARWIRDQEMLLEGGRFFEVGTGHNPIVPIGFFLSGAESVITIDLHRRLDLNILRGSLVWMAEHRRLLESTYSEVVAQSVLGERLDLLARLQSDPRKFLKEANIQYLAPADASDTSLPANSIDFHISVATLEHIPKDVIRGILEEAGRILVDKGVGVHLIDPSDHFQHQDASITKINFLRFPEQEWLRIAGNRFAYCSRLRVSDYLALFDELEFDVVRSEFEVDDESMYSLQDGFSLDLSFAGYKLDFVHSGCVT